METFKMAGESDAKEKLDTGNTRVASSVNLIRLRERVRGFIDKHHYDSALFWADKLVALSNGAVEDVYWYSQTLYLTGQYHRAANVILSKKLHKAHFCCRYLAAKCYYECKDYQEGLNILNLVENSSLPSLNKQLSFSVIQSLADADRTATNKSMLSSMNLLRGKIYEALDNRDLAMECFREALNQDVYCYEAFDLLVSHHMLSAQEERELLDSMPFSAQCSSEEVELIKCLYETKLKKYDKPGKLVIPESLSSLNENLEVIVGLAERHYYNCDFRECHKITSRVLEKDAYNSQCLPLHIAVLVELKKQDNLFYLAHKLVDLYPNKPVSWFAVGCYYHLINKSDPARRYLTKATMLDRPYGPAWLVFGHSFAAEKEHDQAMAAYFTASQLMKGCHLPALYIGLEYGLTNNPKLAERFFSQAISIAPEDPFVLHEMGIVAFQNGDWLTAEKYLKDALQKVQLFGDENISEKWEPLLNNLGHTCRKLKKYQEALKYHELAKVLEPQSPSTYSAIGYVYALMGENTTAVDYFQEALSKRRDDAFSTTMLSNLLESMMTEMNPSELGDVVLEGPTFAAPDMPFFSPERPDALPVRKLFDPLETSGTQGLDSSADASSLMIQEVEMDDAF